mgnify:CR=1 FL=1
MMNDIETFKPETKTIKQIFGDIDAFYHMPIYQRPYSWDKERVEQLWYDIVEAYHNNKDNPDEDSNYFLGTVVVINKKGSYEVVDGQQRLTTLTILFCVLRDLTLVDLTKAAEKSICNSVRDLVEEKERLKLTTHDNNQAIFESTVINSIDFNATKKDIVENRFLQNAFYFKSLIEESINGGDNKINDFNGFIDYFLNKVSIIRIVCFNENFAIKLFSVLNDRGLDLNSTDIIKAFLLQNLNEDKRVFFIEEWKKIESNAKYSGESLQSIFNYYLYYLKSDNPKKSLQDELKEQFKNKNPIDVVLDVKKFSDELVCLNDENNNKSLSLLRYLTHSLYWKTILITAKHVNYSDYYKLCDVIKRYYYQTWISGGTLNRMKQTSFRIMRMVKELDDISKIESVVKENILKYDNYKKNILSGNVYYNKWHKPLLLAIEYELHDEKDFIKITNGIHTEHVLPRGWDKEGLNWPSFFSKEEADSLLNSIGNLTLISGTKNIQASNSNFEDKMGIYKGIKGDGKTSFEISKMIADRYHSWDPASIKSREDWMLEHIEKIFDFGD